MKIKKLMIFILFLTGLLILLYPILARHINEEHAIDKITEYKNHVEKIDSEQLDEVKKKLKEHNKLITDNIPANNAECAEIPKELVPDKDIIAYIEIPSIEVNLPVYNSDSEENLERGAGHVTYTSFPIGGESTHSVIAAHSGMSGFDMFRNLDLLTEGDMFYIHIFDEILAYQVDSIKVVDPDEFEYIKIIEGEDHLTLLTCTPYGINAFRLLVRGTRVEYDYENTVTYNNITAGNEEKNEGKTYIKEKIPHKEENHIENSQRNDEYNFYYRLLLLIPATAVVIIIVCKKRTKKGVENK